MTLVHWDDVQSFAIPDDAKPLGGRWQRLADAAGSVRVGMQRVTLASGQLATPPHLHSAEEEIYFVLSGSATLWQDGKTSTVSTGDTVVFTPGGPTHTLIGGEEGATVLIFGTRLTPESGILPRTKTAWLARSPVHFGETHPWEEEAKLGLPDGEPGERPANVVALAAVEGDYGGIWKRVGATGGATRTGLNWVYLPPNEEGAPPHCHTADEEVFVILDGEGIFELWGPPKAGEAPATEPIESHPVRAGHVISRPASTARSHCLRTRDSAMTYLAFGTREPNDVCYYPRSNTIFWRGLGLVARLEPLDQYDGEPA
ncbi:MAG TPA: cupin domain-containing protein [Gaiellaceae bacterium]